MISSHAIFTINQNAVDYVNCILSAGIPKARIELVDEHSIKQVNEYNELAYEEKPTIFMEFHGNEAGLEQDVEFMQEIVRDYDCNEIQFERDTKSRFDLWEVRHNLAYAFIHSFPRKKMMVTDVTVPLTELAGAIVDTRKAIEEIQLHGALVGHVGDGNYHAVLMIDMNDEEEVEKANQINAHIVNYALERGGTCTGEHGVGVGKAMYQKREHGKAYDVMKQIKKTFDPNNILNPGKIFID